MISPSGEVKTISPLKRLGSSVSAAFSVGAMSIARRDRRDLGVTNFPRQSDCRTWMRLPSKRIRMGQLPNIAVWWHAIRLAGDIPAR
jgi:hypothetical protein